ncbi:ATP-binding cassette domain-containing protein [Amycolatopsis rubida]|uniref:ATP-binding cassette domain-containing protein n=1 Tax=Amycolatopsis rubida TaxID=112413 RepID=A0ABX0C1C6_9PSEU|nr:ATP-binding cassette domain-containing protein [Amycolatopsis rubida]OAP22946.1 Teichoic acids export ATP-binding protein TagH [Amycolatopsis sp. M39]
MIGVDLCHAFVEFPVFDAKSRSLKRRVLGSPGGRIQTGAKVPVVTALRDLTASFEEGDRVGLVGHNGAGKSTLLRLLAGIHEPTRGSARRSGRVAPVFDLGLGMDPETSGLENIVVRGMFLGMTRRQMRARTDEIAEFTELGDYLRMPLRTYSAGMRVRLALGVVTSIDPEILLLDEGIGAVDADFLERARSRLHDLVNRCGLLVFASHTEELLLDLCDSALWLESGRIVRAGSAAGVVRAYRRRSVAEDAEAQQAEKRRAGHDPVDDERGERVLGDEFQQPGDRSAGDGERHERADRDRQQVDPAADRVLQLAESGSGQRGNGQEERQPGRGDPVVVPDQRRRDRCAGTGKPREQRRQDL